MDEVRSIVLDNGSSTIYAGTGGEDAPSVVMPSLVGRPRVPVVMVGGGQKEHYIGGEAVGNRSFLALKHPVQHGVVQDWDDMDKVWHHTFFNELRIEPEEHPVLLTDATRNPRSNRERMVQSMMETFKLPATFVANQAVLTLYASGAHMGFPVCLGDGVIHGVPIEGVYVFRQGIFRTHATAGCALTAHLRDLLAERGYHDAFGDASSAEMQIVRGIKETLCYVAADPAEEANVALMSNSLEREYTLPDGRSITLGSERYRCHEALFQPAALLQVEQKGLHEMLHAAVMRCPIDSRRMFFDNIILSGGVASVPGIAERLLAEMNRMVPSGVKVHVVNAPERRYSVWIGGSIMASLSTFQQQWISKEMYDENGPTIVHTRCGL